MSRKGETMRWKKENCETWKRFLLKWTILDSASFSKDHNTRQTFYGFRLHMRLSWPGDDPDVPGSGAPAQSEARAWSSCIRCVSCSICKIRLLRSNWIGWLLKKPAHRASQDVITVLRQLCCLCLTKNASSGFLPTLRRFENAEGDSLVFHRPLPSSGFLSAFIRLPYSCFLLRQFI